MTSILSRNLPLPKYFTSAPSFAQYHLPRKNPHAFSSVVGAAAGVAKNDPNQRSEAERESEERELAERFVVGWIEVEVEIDDRETDKDMSGMIDSGDTLKIGPRGTYGSGIGGMNGMVIGGIGIGMGTREERRSFGSDATSSRTATPTSPSHLQSKPRPNASPGIGAETLGSTSYKNTSYLQEGGIRRSSSGSSKLSQNSVPTGTGTDPNPRHGTLKNIKEKSGRSQLKRMEEQGKKKKKKKKTKIERQLVAITYSGDWYRLRLPDLDDDEDGKKGRKCELVEYRRLRVGGGGW